MRIIMLCAVLCCGLAGLADQHLYYTGTINSTLAVQMELTFHGRAVSGKYAYDKVGTTLYVEGSRIGKALVLKEEVGDFTKTGTFTGPLSADLHTFTGTWRSADQQRNFPFSLHAVAVYKSISQEKNHFTLGGEYPVMRPVPSRYICASVRSFLISTGRTNVCRHFCGRHRPAGNED